MEFTEASRAKKYAEEKLKKRDIPGAEKYALKAQGLYPQLDGLSQLMAAIEASRAKKNAEEKLKKHDIPGAEKYALKAQRLCPQLDGLSQLMATIDVFVSAANTVAAGEVDWYGVLGVSPGDDDKTVKKQYKNLALLLHPDKNKSPGADSAFKLVSEAWNLLSDNSKRLAYNQRRFPRGFTNTSPSVPPKSRTSSASKLQASVTITSPLVPPKSRTSSASKLQASVSTSRLNHHIHVHYHVHHHN